MTARLRILVLLLCVASIAVAQKPPQIELGFKADKVYTLGNFDNVNLFNGNVIIEIPLGLSYPVSSGLGYHLTLVYNSKVWDYKYYGSATDPSAYYQASNPNLRSNAGMGWRVSLGRLLSPVQWTNTAYQEEARGWVYESASGDEHAFANMDLGTTNTSAAVMVTADGSYLRMVVVGANREVQFPDGTVQVFGYEHGEWRLQSIKDRFGNAVTISYTYDTNDRVTKWTIAEPAPNSRTHTVSFDYFNEMSDTFDEGMNVSSITLQGVSDHQTSRTYSIDFTYTPTEVAYSCSHTWYHSATLPSAPAAGSKRSIHMLTGITLPDQTGYAFSYFTDEDNASCSQGLIRDVTVPTLGKYEYSWQLYDIPDADPCAPTGPRNRTPGISTRTVDGKVWTYRRTVAGAADSQLADPLHPITCGPAQEGGGHTPARWPQRWVRTSVLSPATDTGPRTRNDQYFSVWAATADNTDSRLFAQTYTFGSAITSGYPGSTAGSLGISVADHATADDGLEKESSRSLSQQLWSNCDSSANCTQLVQSTYRRLGELAPFSTTGPLPAKYLFAGALVFSERNVNELDSGCDGACWQQLDHSDFDGAGHFRLDVSSSNFPDAPTASTFKNYAAWTSAQVFDSSKAWLPGAVSDVSRTIGDKTSKATFCVNSNGQVERKRVIAGVSEGAHDVITKYTYYGLGDTAGKAGDLATESTYGGDSQSVATGSVLCSISLGTPLYKNKYEWNGGTLSRTLYLDPATDADISFDTQKYEVDPRSGFVTKSIAADTLATSYEYDSWGRLKKVTPPGTSATTYTYANAATTAGVLSQLASVTAQTGSESTVVKTIYEYDVLGRPTREKRLMPGDSWSMRETLYDAVGRQKSTSEFAALPADPDDELAFSPPAKTLSSYDPLGRPLTIEAPDESETTFVYTGSRKRSRTMTGGGLVAVAATTTETYDGLGRLVSVAENSGPAGGLVVTSYGYDAGDRLSSVKMTGPEGVQNRTFDYDGRGFLRWESQPESGMRSYTYDARGHMLSKIQSAARTYFDQNYSYDAAERLLSVQERNPFNLSAFRPLKVFTFANANGTASPVDYVKGKLQTATRYNYSYPGSLYSSTITVTETYGYRDAGGRQTDRTTEIVNSDQTGSVLTTQSTSYDELGRVKTVSYPICDDCGLPPGNVQRTITSTYDNGSLTGLSDFVTAVSYWPNGMRHDLTHTNGIIDRQTVDATGMPRPASLSSGLYNTCTAPAITFQTTNEIVSSAHPSAYLSVTASGTAPLAYQWEAFPGGLIAGANGSSLTVSPTVNTRYQVTITNGCNSVVSNMIYVDVGECAAPRFINFPKATANANGTWTLSGTASGSPTLAYGWFRMPENVSVGTTATLQVSTPSVMTKYEMRVSNGCGTITQPVWTWPSITDPSGLSATFNGTNQIDVTWLPSTNISQYHLERRGGGFGWTAIAEVQSTHYVDTAVSPNTSYAYRVSGVIDPSSGVMTASSNMDLATTIAFRVIDTQQLPSHDDFDQVLLAVNAVRANVGWAAVSWGDILAPGDPLPAPDQGIRAKHLLALRARMNEAVQALGIPVSGYTDADLSGVPIKATHITELQGKVK